MRILGIETSCDETSAAVIEADQSGIKVLSTVVATSLSLHAKTGGIIPEIAAREQIKYILPVIEKALEDSRKLEVRSGKLDNESLKSRNLEISPSTDRSSSRESRITRLASSIPDIDAIAVTYGPGLIGSLLVGVETAKTLSYVWGKPLIPVNHLYGHIYANWIHESTRESTDYELQTTADRTVEFPALALIVSGAHTDLVLMKDHKDILWLGGTRDDAAGEAFDKIGRMLGLAYPAGATISQLAKKGNPKAFLFPRPLIGSKDSDFSFSGLKTAVHNQIKLLAPKTNDSPRGEAGKRLIADICASTEAAIVDVLVKKTLTAAKKYNVKSILLGGGVAANEKLREEMELNAKRYCLDAKIFAPAKSLCTDNAAMIAVAAYFNNKEVSWKKLVANPELYFD